MGLTSIIVVLSLSLLASNANLAPRTNDVLEEQLYNNVIVGDYANAVAQTRTLENEEKGDVIKAVVNRLVEESKRNVVDYAYQLWNENLQETVRTRFPIQFRLVVGGNYVKLIDKQYGLAMKLDANVDDDKDRAAWGDSKDKTTKRVSWKFAPEWTDNRVHFKIVNSEFKIYLKMSLNPDSYGDHQVYGSDGIKGDEMRHEWYLHPVKNNNELLFYIINCEKNQGLKEDANTDGYGDRLVWGNNGDIFNKPESYGWYIVPF